jgi:uncharacterized membrane protein HdeD (DUF308 family)
MDMAVKRMARFLGVGGLASIVFGLIVLLWPGISLVALTVLFGAYAFVYGVFAVAAGLYMLARRGNQWVAYIVGGAAGVLLGVITFLRPGITDLTLAYLIAAWAFVVGVFEIAAATEMWGEIRGAVWLAIGGVLSIAFGVLVAWRPGTGLLAILWLIGLYAILAGVSRVIAAYRIHQFRSDVKNVVGVPQPTHV